MGKHNPMSKPTVIMMVAKVPNWMLNPAVTTKEVFGVKIDDPHHMVTVDQNGNMKGKLISQDETFSYFQIPAVFYAWGAQSIFKQARDVIKKASPKYVEKRINKLVKQSQANPVFYWGNARTIFLDVTVDPSEFEASLSVAPLGKTKHEKRLAREATAKLRRSQVVELENDKAEAYASYGFFDFDFGAGSFKPLPVYWTNVVDDYIHPQALAMLAADPVNGKALVLQAYQAGRFEWKDVKNLLPSYLNVDYSQNIFEMFDYVVKNGKTSLKFSK